MGVLGSVVATIWWGIVGLWRGVWRKTGGYLGKLEDCFDEDNFLFAALGEYPLIVDTILLFWPYLDL